MHGPDAFDGWVKADSFGTRFGFGKFSNDPPEGKGFVGGLVDRFLIKFGNGRQHERLNRISWSRPPAVVYFPGTGSDTVPRLLIIV